MNTTNFPGRVERRKQDAKNRNKAWADLSPSEQLNILDARLGKGVGAVKQRARILAKLTSHAATNR